MAIERQALAVQTTLRFSDVIEELQTIGTIALASEGDLAGIAEACSRAEALLMSLRRQFLDDVGLEGSTSNGRPAGIRELGP